MFPSDSMNGMLSRLVFRVQKIMNDIFNKHQDFTIVYIDDVFIFFESIDQHFKHLNMFINIIKTNSLVVSLPKVKLF